MSKEWFYVINGERHGPVALPELLRLVREGRLTQSDLVWHPDFGQQWKPARDVSQLMIAFTAADTRPSIEATTPDGVVLTPVEQGASVGKELTGGSASAPLWGIQGESPSAWGAAKAAWRRMVAVLFKPFSLGLWFNLGFCAWIGAIQFGNPLGKVMGSAVQPDPKTGKVDWVAVQELLSQKFAEFLQFVQTPKGQLVILISLSVYILLSLFLLYFNGRGQLMFQYRFYVPKSSISEAWRVSKKGGVSLFRWLLGYQVLLILFWIVTGASAWKLFGADLCQHQWILQDAHIIPIMIVTSIASLVMLTFALARRITVNWIVPVMYCQGVTASAAWKSAWSIIGQHPFKVIGYFIVQDLYMIFFMFVYLFLILGTCCVAMFPFAIPFVQTVLILPVLFFNRGYSTIYLSQWRPDLVTPVNEDGK